MSLRECYVIEFLTCYLSEIRSVIWDDEVLSAPMKFDTEVAADTFARRMIPKYPEFLAYSVKKVMCK